jgi:myosin-5
MLRPHRLLTPCHAPTIHHRFAAKVPYTDSGNICIAVNPYQWLPLYGEATALQYLRQSEGEERGEALPPHVFGVAAGAFSAMVTTGRCQSVLVSGESGAGKTGTRLQSCATYIEQGGGLRTSTPLQQKHLGGSRAGSAQ